MAALSTLIATIGGLRLSWRVTGERRWGRALASPNVALPTRARLLDSRANERAAVETEAFEMDEKREQRPRVEGATSLLLVMGSGRRPGVESSQP